VDELAQRGLIGCRSWCCWRCALVGGLHGGLFTLPVAGSEPASEEFSGCGLCNHMQPALLLPMTIRGEHPALCNESVHQTIARRLGVLSDHGSRDSNKQQRETNTLALSVPSAHSPLPVIWVNPVFRPPFRSPWRLDVSPVTW
jgi:hypothetical protein